MPNLSISKPKQPTSTLASKPLRPNQATPAAVPAANNTTLTSSNEWTAAPDSDWQDGGSQVAADDKPSPPVNISLAGLSKEEKEKEMARRREERKAVSE
jgi:SCY1-like protein 1